MPVSMQARESSHDCQSQSHGVMLSYETLESARPSAKIEKFSLPLFIVTVGVAGTLLLATVPGPGIWLLFAGGACYTFGVAFYLWRRLRYHHAVWHGFVLGGSTCHFLAVLLFLVPGTN